MLGLRPRKDSQMSKGVGRAIALGVVIIVALVLAGQGTFWVDETNHAVVQQFQKIKSVNSSPGLNFKVPFIQNVTYLDKRILTLDTSPQEYLTSDEKRIRVDQVTRWRINNPRDFFLAAGTENSGAARIRPLVDAELRAQIAAKPYDVMISAERDDIMESVKDGLQIRVTEAGLGVEIIDVRTKRADLPPEVEQSVFDRMASARRVEANRHRADGQRKADAIVSETDRLVAIMLACADRVSQEVRGDGEAKAIAIFAQAFQQDPDFFSFLRRLEAYPEIFSNQDRLILSTNTNFFRLLSGESESIPDIDATRGAVEPLSLEAIVPISQEEIDARIDECIPETVQEAVT